jgi:hypothetical protein
LLNIVILIIDYRFGGIRVYNVSLTDKFGCFKQKLVLGLKDMVYFYLLERAEKIRAAF